MKNIKHIFLVVLGCMMCGVMNAQHQELFDEYCREAGDQAEIFAGKMENGYPSTLYVNHPYWLFGDFVAGDVVFNGLLYRNIHIRYDAFLKQLVVNSPVKRLNVYVPMHLVDQFSLGETAYERRNGEFVAILYRSPRMELIERMEVSLKEEIIGVGVDQSKFQFKYKMSYVVLQDGLAHEVKKLKSVLKLYPELKKELKGFSKIHSLDFKENRRTSLVSVMKYVDELLVNPLK